MAVINIFIVTPAFNSAETISRTINSVVSQSGDFAIHYHIQDGGSKDDTVQVVKNWKELIERSVIPIYCKSVKITFSTEKDTGMYDAIVKGYSHHRGCGDDWTGWINSDDMLLPGAFALLSEIDKQLSSQRIDWITGASSVDWDDLPVAWGDRPVNREIISAGLCDGECWSYIQQEGTFFRKKIWDSVDVKKFFSEYRYAGDWNLWRLMAKENEIYQTPWATGNFSRREGQISQAKKGEYLDEINRTISHEVRVRRLFDIAKRSGPRWMIESRFSDKSLHAIQYTLNTQLREQKNKLIKKLIVGNADGGYSNYVNKKSILAYNNEWQYPAVTEKYAFDHMMQSRIELDDETVYFGFPWATLIDLLQLKSEKAWALQEKLTYFVSELKGYKKIITVCQHIWYKKYLYLFDEAGITDLFASHATSLDVKYNYSRKVKIHPFALYPVHAVVSDKILENRKYLYSFVGAKSGEGYLSKARDWIGEITPETDDVFVNIRKGWHYDQIVYDEQIKNIRISEGEKKSLLNKEEEYKFVLSQSIFTLCPSGTGPNSIRLWEAIESNVIPVVISDTYLPPCDSELWSKAVVVIAESKDGVRGLDSYLRTLFNEKDKLNEIYRNLSQLRNEYGLVGFTTPIKNLILDAEVRGYDLTSLPQSAERSSSLKALTALYEKKKINGGGELLGKYLNSREKFEKINALNHKIL
jgi:glycosyltransferase involved in cell wall biosynthesis